jgi:hypothetical protein
MWCLFLNHVFIYVVNSWNVHGNLQIYGVEPAEANVLNGGKPGEFDIL